MIVVFFCLNGADYGAVPAWTCVQAYDDETAMSKHSLIALNLRK